MASAMIHTINTCTNLATMSQTQMLDEDKIDPFPARTTVELEEMLDACRRTKEVLSREELIYSRDADFSKYTDQELVAMNAFVRENSRMLSIILAGGAQQFWNGQGLSTVQELKNMYHYIDGEVRDFFLIDKILDTLDIKMKYGRKAAMSKTANPATHPELLAFSALDANRAATSQETLMRLAEVCEKFAVQCRSIAQTRIGKMGDRSRKMEVKEQLLREVDELLPMLRQHVLRIGLSKSQLKEGTAKEQAAGFGSHSHKLTSLFTHRAVEDAHRTVEDCRERLMQELLFRRAKVERRLQREAVAEVQKEKDIQKLGKVRDGSRMSNLESYQAVLELRDERNRPSATQSEFEPPGRGRRNQESPSKSREASSSSLGSPAPKPRPRTLQKGGSKTTLGRAVESPASSPGKSPKARPKRANAPSRDR